MKILGIDTSTPVMCIGLYDKGKLYDYSLEAGARLSFLLAPTIKRVLDALGWLLADIDYFACGLGPGSFTGLRIGLAAIKGFAWSLKKPVIGVSSLDILARNAAEAKSIVAPVIDAKRSLLYYSGFKIKNGVLRRTMPYCLGTADELCKKIKPGSVLVGDGLSLHKDSILRNTKGITIMDKDYWNLKPHNIIVLALERIYNKQENTAFDIKPIYLYPKECQIRNALKQKR